MILGPLLVLRVLLLEHGRLIIDLVKPFLRLKLAIGEGLVIPLGGLVEVLFGALPGFVAGPEISLSDGDLAVCCVLVLVSTNLLLN